MRAGVFHLVTLYGYFRLHYMQNLLEAVAYGAAVQAAIVSGQGHEDVQNMLLGQLQMQLGIRRQIRNYRSCA